MLILGIETSCDETAAAVVRDGQEILSNVVSSQQEIHGPFGGVVPELASRQHLERIEPVIRFAVKEAGCTLEKLDAIAVAQGPGLLGALLVGINAAKGLVLGLSKPLIPVNHVEAHVYAALMQRPQKVRMPALGVVISGGHTALLRIDGIGAYALLGKTQDDAVGEAFDKVASMLKLPYPGGPAVEQLARSGDERRYPLKAGRIKERPLDFSFSGLKTSVLYTIRDADEALDAEGLAASFQRVALEDIVDKTLLAVKTFPCRSILIGGGVANNQKLRELFAARGPSVPLFWPPSSLTLDNAAMIAALAYYKPSVEPTDLEALPRLEVAVVPPAKRVASKKSMPASAII